MKSFLALSIAALLFSPTTIAHAATFRTVHVTVNYFGITEAQAKSLSFVTEAARKAAIERFGFDVPRQITMNVVAKANNQISLWTDGHDTINLKLRSDSDLGPPDEGHPYNLYGICHELGHIVMYRRIADRRWMTSDVAESWAHYFGSRIVDDVFDAEGENVWWIPYDYRADGMKRLQSELAAPDTTAFTRMAGKWMELAEIVGEKNMPKLFAAWDKARIDIRNPSPAILAGLLQTSHDPRIVDWWKTAQSPMIRTPSVSDFTPSQPTRPAAANKKAAGKKTELAIDDGEPKGKLSLARSGHAVGFEAPADGCNLILVKIFGSRYGTPYPPAEDFHVYLCDADGKQIKDFSFPYKNFLYGSEHWVTLKLPKPAEVPKNFILCIDFNPTKTKGVYVCHDAQCDGDSRTGLPGELDNTFENGDWMIRAVITGPPPNVKRVRNDRPRDNLGK